MAKYILIYDTGDMLFDTQKEAYKFAKWLQKKGHRLDRLQIFRNEYERTYKRGPRIIKSWYKKRK